MAEHKTSGSSDASQNAMLHKFLSSLCNKIEKVDLRIKNGNMAIIEALTKINNSSSPTNQAPPITLKSTVSNGTRKHEAYSE